MQADTDQDLIRGGVNSIERFLGGHYFRPAAVQREYQWGPAECGTLLADFERAWLAGREEQSVSATASHPYFVGSFVLLPLGPNEFEVFDGLQRLTTLTVLFAVMRDLLDGIDGPMHARLSGLVHDAAGTPHLSLGSGDQTLANLIQAQSEAIRQRRNLAANTLRARLLNAAGFFKARLKDMNPADLIAFAGYILTQVRAGVIEVSNERLARQIFITTNNRGVPLNEADVLKSQINSIPFRQDVADRVLTSWNAVRSGFRSDEDYTAFLYSVDFLTRRRGRGSDGLTGLGEHLALKLDDESILDWLNEYESLAGIWHWLNAARGNPRRSDPAEGHAACLFAFEWSEWKPAAMLLARQLVQAQKGRDRRKVKLLTERFDSLNAACAAITLAETPETERARLFARAISDIEASRDPSGHALATTESRLARISQVLSAPVFDDALAAQILRWLELGAARQGSSDVLTARLERVLPLHPDEFSEWQKDFPASGERWQLAHAWGNLVLQFVPETSGAPPDSFGRWKKSVTKDTARLSLNASVLRENHWTADRINTRTAEIRNRLLTLIRGSSSA